MIDLAIIVNLKGRLFLNYGVRVEIYMLPFGKLNSFLSIFLGPCCFNNFDLTLWLCLCLFPNHNEWKLFLALCLTLELSRE